MEDAVRLRMEFEDHRQLLTKSQRSEGLRRCWLLLRPDLSTVSDLAAHLVRAFALHRSCPHGLLLSMDDFVLPPCESTRIFKDKDVVRVRKKVAKKKQLLEICGDAYDIQDSKIVVKQPILSGDELLAIKDLQEYLKACKSKNGEDACEVEENAINRQSMLSEEMNLKRKRKQLDKHQNSKSKKLKLTSSKKNIVTADREENIQFEQHKSLNTDQTHILSNGDEKFDKLINSQNEVQKKNSSVMTEERHDQVENSCESPSEPDLTGNVKKFPSRSARRKKAKKQWRRKMANEQLKEVFEIKEDVQGEVLANDTQVAFSKHQAVDQTNEIYQTSEIEEEIVPVIVRPGHIRFEPIDGEHNNMQSNGLAETLQWNGTTSKKKGQKWGMEKTLSRRNEDYACDEALHEKLITEERKHANDDVDVESFFPLTRLPEEGDMLVYRLVELSSSWCPELSPFRVGKVSSYDSTSTKIVLVPVPEYPIFSNENKDAEETAEQQEPTLYKEDGSLEIEYTSLIDVRLFKAYDSGNVQNEKSKEAARSNNSELASVATNSKHSATSLSGWEQIDQALSERKAQLEKTGGMSTWMPSKSAGTASWSYRALRGSALGPTVALLRLKDDNSANSSGK